MVEKKQLGKGGNDMTNKMMFTLEINKDSLIIKVNEKKVKTLSIKNKNINTTEIYNMLKYDRSNEYKLILIKYQKMKLSEKNKN